MKFIESHDPTQYALAFAIYATNGFGGNEFWQYGDPIRFRYDMRQAGEIEHVFYLDATDKQI
jgi:hypothetical protein